MWLQRCEVAESDVASARAESAAASSRERELQADLERLLRQRSEVATLRAELEAFAPTRGDMPMAGVDAGPSGTLRYAGAEPAGGKGGDEAGGVELPEPDGFYFQKLTSGGA